MITLDQAVELLKSFAGVALLTEPVVQTIKNALPFQLTEPQKQLLSVLVALVLSPLMVQPGLTVSANVVVWVIGAMLASRGANVIHDLLDTLQAYAARRKAQAEYEKQYLAT